MTITIELVWDNIPSPLLRLRSGESVSKWSSYPKFRNPQKEADCWANETDPWYEWITDLGGCRYVTRIFEDGTGVGPWTHVKMYLASEHYGPKSRAECLLEGSVPAEVTDGAPDEDDEWQEEE